MTDLKQLIELGRRLQSCLLHNDCDMSALEINVALKEFDLPNILPLLEELEGLRNKPSDEVIEQVADDEAYGQDCDSLSIKKLYADAFAAGAKWMRSAS